MRKAGWIVAVAALAIVVAATALSATPSASPSPIAAAAPPLDPDPVETFAARFATDSAGHRTVPAYLQRSR